jgi:PncC family amidohydrolase
VSDLARELVDALRETGRTISTAESCTAGGLAHEITRIPGASACFVGSVIAYANEVKTTLLRVPESTLARHGAVSAEVAEAMASSCLDLFATDIAVSITGIAGPGGGTPEKPVGLVFVAVAGEVAVLSRRFDFTGSRDEVRAQATTAALRMASAFLADR